jgi:hypothetical protein
MFNIGGIRHQAGVFGHIVQMITFGYLWLQADMSFTPGILECLMNQ